MKWKCPKCGSENCDGGVYAVKDGEPLSEIECHDCGYFYED